MLRIELEGPIGTILQFLFHLKRPCSSRLQVLFEMKNPGGLLLKLTVDPKRPRCALFQFPIEAKRPRSSPLQFSLDLMNPFCPTFQLLLKLRYLLSQAGDFSIEPERPGRTFLGDSLLNLDPREGLMQLPANELKLRSIAVRPRTPIICIAWVKRRCANNNPRRTPHAELWSERVVKTEGDGLVVSNDR